MKTLTSPADCSLKSSAKWLTLTVSLLLIQVAQAVVTLPFYDGIDYADGTLLGVQPNWSLGNGTGTQGGSGQLTVSNSAALSYSGLAESTGNGVYIPAATTSRNKGVELNETLTSGSTDVLYASFLLNIQSTPAANRMLMWLRSSTGAGTAHAGVYVNSSGQLMISKNSNTAAAGTTTALAVNTTHLVVVRYKVVTGSSNDEIKLWLDPASGTLGAEEGSVPGESLLINSGGDPASAATFTVLSAMIPLNTSTGFGLGTYQFDEFRIARTWAEVTPPGGCVPATVNSGANPSTTNVTAGNSATFAIASSGSSRTFQWQSSADSGANWANIGGAGNSSYTTPALMAVDNNTQYRCIVNVACDSSSATSGVATVTVICNPAAISQSPPPTQTAYEGATTTFSVTASGTARLYDWQVSTDAGNNWGSVGSSSNYTTGALSAGDNNSQYRCIVSVPCDNSSVTSSVSTLSIVDPTVLSFRSGASGNWTSLSTWEQSNDGSTWVAATAIPVSLNSNITVRTGHTVSVTTPVEADDLVVESGAQVDVSGGSLTITDDPADAVDCQVLGTLSIANVTNSALFANGSLTFGNGGRYLWARSGITILIPTATWEDGSTCEIQAGGNGIPTGLNQSFHDFYWNKTSSGAVNLGAQLTTVRNELRINAATDPANSVRFLAAGSCDLNVGGDVVLAGGYTTLSGGSGAVTLNLRVGGNFSVNSGATLDSRNSGSGSAANIEFVNTSSNQTLTIAGAVTHTGTGGGCPINWNIQTGVTVKLESGLALLNANNATTDSVTVDGTLDCDGNQLTGSNSGNLVINAGGTLVGEGTGAIATGLARITYGGTLNLPNLPTTLNNGDALPLFPSSGYAPGTTFNSIIPASTPVTGFGWDQSDLDDTGTLYVGVAGVAAFAITSSQLAGDQMTLTGTGGSPFGNFTVVTTTDISTPIGSWTQWTTGSFDASGNFSVTAAINTANAQSYYRISQ